VLVHWFYHEEKIGSACYDENRRCKRLLLPTAGIDDAGWDKKGDTGEIVILVDTDTSKENVSRAAKSQSWQVKEVLEEGGGYRITISREG